MSHGRGVAAARGGRPRRPRYDGSPMAPLPRRHPPGLRLGALLSVLLLLSGLAPWLVIAQAPPPDSRAAGRLVEVTTFADGSSSVLLHHEGFDFNSTSVEIPHNVTIVDATLRISGRAVGPNATDVPHNVSLDLGDDNIPDFLFAGAGYGGLGLQHLFVSDNDTQRVEVDANVANGSALYLPKGATISAASLNLSGVFELSRAWTKQEGTKADALLSASLSNVGDINGDGQEDLAIGIPLDDQVGQRAGAVRLYWGGSPIDLDSPDMTLHGPTEDFTQFGWSIAGGSDLNGDGEPDLVVGAPGNHPIKYGCNPFGFCAWAESWDMGGIYLFWGGSALDAAWDLRIDGDGSDTSEVPFNPFCARFGRAFDRMGVSVSIGDVDDDGWDDIVTATPELNQLNNSQCPPHVPFDDGVNGGVKVIKGGPGLDNWTDYFVNATPTTDEFGTAVGLMDFDGDSVPDIVTSGPGAGVDLEGRVDLLLGGSPLDLTFDASWSGTTTWGKLGSAMGSPGDIDGDSLDDLLVGEPFALTGSVDGQPVYNGTVSVILGSAALDVAIDHTFVGTQPDAAFGSGLGFVADVTGDGLPDFSIQSAHWTSSPLPADESVGRFDLYASIDGALPADLPIYTIIGDDTYAEFGATAAGGFDLNDDGFTDFILGAPNYDGAAGNNTGAVFLIEAIPFRPTDPALRLGPAGVLLWSTSGSWFGTVVLDDPSATLSDRLQTFLDAAPSDFTDASGNAIVRIPLTLSSTTDAAFAFAALEVRYDYVATVRGASGDLAADLDALLLHQPFGIPLDLHIESFSSTPGDLLLEGLDISLDPMPYDVGLIDEVQVPEDTFEPQAVALDDLVRDDDGPVLYTLLNITGEPPVGAWLEDGYLAIDAATGPDNDNWTGSFKVLITATDSANTTYVPDATKVRILPVNDAPVIVSAPLRIAVAGFPYEYKLWADDAEDDPLTWALVEAPAGMSLDPVARKLVWAPQESDIGTHQVTIDVDDGELHGSQSYSLRVVPPNIPPRFIAPLPDIARVGFTYKPQVQVTDDDGDVLTVALALGPPMMEYLPQTGRLEWVPTAVGTAPVAVNVTDGIATVWQNYTITVTDTVSNQLPVISTIPPTSGIVGHRYSYPIEASDPDGDALTYHLHSAPPGAILVDDPSGGALLEWTPTPDQVGSFPMRIDVDDGKGFSQQRWEVRVTDVGANGLPVFRNSPPTSAVVGFTYRHDADAVDPEGAVVTYAIEQGTPQMVFDAHSGELLWTPLFADAGAVELTLRADDGIGYARQTTTIAVSDIGANHLPQLLNSPPTTASVGSLYQWAPLVTDPDGDEVTLALLPTSVDARLGGTDLHWRVLPEDPKQVPLGLRLSDGKGFFDVHWTVAVSGGYDGPLEPTVTFVDPQDNHTVRGSAVPIEGISSTPLREVLRVELRIGDGPWFVVNGTLTWSYTLDTTSYDDGPVVLHARALTAKETSPEANLTLVIDNTPDRDDSRVSTTLGLSPFEWFLLLLLGVVVVVAIVIQRQRKRREEEGSLSQAPREDLPETEPEQRARPRNRPPPRRPPAPDPYAESSEEQWSEGGWDEEVAAKPPAPPQRPPTRRGGPPPRR